jgi:AcrR family transcriptional regulator
MAQLAEDLEITKAALYYYYPDKESLFLAMVTDYLNGVGHELEQLPGLFEQDDPRAAFGAVAEVFLSRHETSGQMQQLSMQESRHLSEVGRNTLSGTYHGLMVRPLAALLNRATERGWIRATLPFEPPSIWLFLGLLTAFLQPDHGGPGSLTDRVAAREAFVNLFLKTLQGAS